MGVYQLTLSFCFASKSVEQVLDEHLDELFASYHSKVFDMISNHLESDPEWAIAAIFRYLPMFLRYPYLKICFIEDTLKDSFH